MATKLSGRRFRGRSIILVLTLASLAVAPGSVAAEDADAPSRIEAALARGDFVAARRWLEPLAQRGDALAQSNLALLHFRGLGTPRNFGQAARWYRLAAEQQDPVAENALGMLHKRGLGVPRDLAEAERWYRRAAERGHPQHQFDLAELYDTTHGTARNVGAALRLYEQAATQGHAESEANLGALLLAGDGTDKDVPRALKLLESAAAKGVARAQNNLGVLYSRGEEVELDHAKAVAWYRQAAAQGLKEALTNLGVMYENGFGVERSEAEAIRLYRQGGRGERAADEPSLDRMSLLPADPLAVPLPRTASLDDYRSLAATGDLVAQLALAGLLSARLVPGPALSEAARWYARAAEQGSVQAMHDLGVLHARGLGTPEDFVLGYVWLNMAAASGLAAAAEKRDALLARLTPGQVAEAEAMLGQMAPGIGAPPR